MSNTSKSKTKMNTEISQAPKSGYFTSFEEIWGRPEKFTKKEKLYVEDALDGLDNNLKTRVLRMLNYIDKSCKCCNPK